MTTERRSKDKQQEADDIAAKVEEFKSNGGSITECPPPKEELTTEELAEIRGRVKGKFER